MANDLGVMRAALELESAAFIRDLTKASQATSQATSKMQSSMAGLNKSFAAVGASVKTFISGFIGLKSIRTFEDIVKTADEIGDTSQRLGIAAEDLQRFRFAAEQAGVGVGEVDTALKLFTKNLAAGKVAAEGGSLFEQFTNFIQKIRDAPTQMDEVTLATQAAGKQFSVLLQIARESPEAFRAAFSAAAVYSAQALSTADQLDKQFRAIKDAVEVGFGTGVLAAFNSGLGTTAEKLTTIENLAKEFGSLVGATIKTDVRDATAILNGFNTTLDFFITQYRRLKAIRDEISAKEFGLAKAPGTPGPFAPGGAVGAGLLPEPIPAKPLGDSLAELQKQIGDFKTTVEGAKIDQTVALWADTFQSFGDTAAETFADAIVESKKFSDVMTDLTKQLEKMAINAALRQVFSLLIGAPTVPAGSAPGGQATAGTGLLGALGLHAGGVVGQAGAYRGVPAGLFAGAPRLHSGLRSGEFPAILQAGEQVIPKGAGDGVTVNVINRGSPLEQDGASKFDGRTLEIFVKNSVNRGFARGEFDSTLGNRFGISRGTAVR